MTSNRWLTIALVISVVVNIGMIGFFAGRASAGDFKPPRLDPTMNLNRVIRALPPERRDELRAPIRAHLQHMRSNTQGVRNAQQQLSRTLSAETLDKQALQVSLDEFRNELCESMATGNQSLVNLATLMTPDERVLLLQSFGPPGRSHRPARRPRVEVEQP
jgi:uncharacterized membrane protein